MSTQTNLSSVRVLDSNVLIERAEAASTSAGGIIIPEQAKERPKTGKVISTGLGRLLDNGQCLPFQVKPGDTVLFSSYAGTEVKIDNRTLVVMEEADILAVVE